MRTTVFELRSGAVVTDRRDEPQWQPFDECDGKPLELVRLQDLLEPGGALIQLVEIAAARKLRYDWHAVEKDTLLSVCLVRQSG
jgi:hypothetical protein